jgi:hypothetical protein
MSAQRRRGLVRLAILVGSLGGLALLGVGVFSGDSGGTRTSTVGAHGSAPPARLTATTDSARLPEAVHGNAAATTAGGVLVIGGELPSGTSTDRVYRFDPSSGKIEPQGRLAQPLHDAAATTVRGRTLVFGGGNTSTLDLVQALSPSGVATQVGRLPAALSDLSAVPLAGAAYTVGGFDGQAPDASVLQTVNGAAFTRVARLPTPVRYAATATIGDKIYAFGGELADGSETNEIQEYDVGTERAVIAGHLPDPVSHAAALDIHGSIYLLGGRVRGAAIDRILRFDPSRGAVSRAGRLPYPVYDGAAASFGGRGYLLGGLGSSGSSLDTVIALR